jgi:hypothetical protein
MATSSQRSSTCWSLIWLLRGSASAAPGSSLTTVYRAFVDGKIAGVELGRAYLEVVLRLRGVSSAVGRLQRL